MSDLYNLTVEEDQVLTTYMNHACDVLHGIAKQVPFFAKYTTRINEQEPFYDLELANAQYFPTRHSRLSPLYIVGHRILNDKALDDNDYPKCGYETNQHGLMLQTALSQMTNHADYQVVCVQLSDLVYGFYLYLPHTANVRLEITNPSCLNNTHLARTSKERATQFVLARKYVMNRLPFASEHVDIAANSLQRPRTDFINNLTDICPLFVSHEHVDTLSHIVTEFNQYKAGRDYLLRLERSKDPYTSTVQMVLNNKRGNIANLILTPKNPPIRLPIEECKHRNRIVKNSYTLLKDSILVLDDYRPFTMYRTDKLHAGLGIVPSVFTTTNSKTCIVGILDTKNQTNAPRFSGSGLPLNDEATKMRSLLSRVININHLKYDIQVCGRVDNALEFIVRLP